MIKRTVIFFISAFTLLLFGACAYNFPEGIARSAGSAAGGAPPHELYSPDEIYAREQLLAMGFTEDMLSSLADGGISFRNMLNQTRFSGYADRISINQPVGPSGEVILPEYSGGLYFNDDGILTVTVLDGAFTHEPSLTAIEEMRELGIIVRTVSFTYQELNTAIGALNRLFEDARNYGSSSWGLDTIENRVAVRLDPYTDEQKEIFRNFLSVSFLSPAMFALRQAVTQEMRDYRAIYVAAATAYAGSLIVLTGDVTVSRSGIAFSLENRSNSTFNYGRPWDLAYYSQGRWVPVPYLPGLGASGWFAVGYRLQKGGVQQYLIDWTWRFGELPPGRYMFIRSGDLGEWDMNPPLIKQTDTRVLVEFFITEDSPPYLPPELNIRDRRGQEPECFVNLVEHRDVTPFGMTVVVENTSPYDIDHRAQISAIVCESEAKLRPSSNWWEWNGLPFLPVEGYWIDYLMQGQGFLPAGGLLEFELDWTKVIGELSPGRYRIILHPGGHAHPPHPTGWAFGDTRIISFTVD